MLHIGICLAFRGYVALPPMGYLYTYYSQAYSC